MTKWETVFTETLASLVSGKGDELSRLWLDKNLELEARSMCCIAAIIASEATRMMIALQPLDRAQRQKAADKPIEKDSFWISAGDLLDNKRMEGASLSSSNGNPVQQPSEGEQ